MLALGYCVGVSAQSDTDAIGEVRLVIGQVNLDSSISGSRLLQLGDEIYQGDQLTTPASGYAVITLVDKTKFTIKPNSIFKFNSVSNNANGEVLSELLKGGLKAITGQIGNQNPPGFKVDTPLGSIGIRGTDFDARLCQKDDCVLIHEALGCPAEPPKQTEGLLYVTVSDGVAYLDDCKNDPDINVGQVGITDGSSENCRILDEVPCFLNEFAWQGEQHKDQTLKSLEAPVLQDQNDPNFLCQGDPICIQCQGDPLCIQCNGDPECYQCQGDPVCLQCQGDPLCIQCQGDPLCIQCQGDSICIQCQNDPLCIQCQGDPLCIQCQGDSRCIQCQGDPICIRGPESTPSGGEEPVDPCRGDPICQQCNGDPLCIQCQGDPLCIQCNDDPLCVQCQGDQLCIDCDADPICIQCQGDPTCISCEINPDQQMCMGSLMCTTPGCIGECGTSPSPGCICAFEPNRPFCP